MQGFGGTEDKDGDGAVETAGDMGGTSKKVSSFQFLVDWRKGTE